MPTPKAEVLQGTLDLLVLKTLDTMGPMHGFGIAQRIQQVSEDLLRLNQGTLYPALLRLEQRGWISSKWGVSENKRNAKFYSLTRSGRRQLRDEAAGWEPNGCRDQSRAQGHLMTEPVRTLAARFLALFHRGSLDRDLDAELRSHVDIAIEHNLQNGMSLAQARREALLGFGGLEQTKQIYRERRGLPFLETLLQDLRFGVRVLWRSPGFSLLAILCLTLGIGTNAAVFSWVEGILLRPYPLVSHQERLVAPVSYTHLTLPTICSV